MSTILRLEIVQNDLIYLKLIYPYTQQPSDSNAIISYL